MGLLISNGLKTTQNHLENLSSDTNKIVTSHPEMVNTWQSSRTLEWVSVFQNSFKGSQDILHPSPFDKQFTTLPNKLIKYKKYFNTEDFIENSIELRLKQEYPPAQEK